ncbi:MAG: hypothetical protein IK124_00690 [Prevotella sp.]|nr:hypothetical protein [Prevotella sp.]
MLKILYFLLSLLTLTLYLRISSYHDIYHLLKNSKYEDLTGIEKPIRIDGIYVCTRQGDDSISGEKEWLDVRAFVFFDDGMFVATFLDSCVYAEDGYLDLERMVYMTRRSKIWGYHSGYYQIINDTLHLKGYNAMQLLLADWDPTDYYFKIKDANYLYLYQCCEIKWDRDYKFIPTTHIPKPFDHYWKKRKRFWKNKEDWKAYKRQWKKEKHDKD